MKIHDSEYNLNWTYLPNRVDPDIVDARLVDALKFEQRQPGLRFPSFEQFVTLVEGLYRIKANTLADGALYILEDKPGRHYQLIAQLNSDITQSPILKPLCKKMRIVGTSAYVNCYQVGAAYAPEYATELIVDQLYIDDEQAGLFGANIDRIIREKVDR